MPAIRNGRTRSAHHGTTGSFELPSTTAYDNTLIRPGALVSVNTQRGARSAIVHRLFNSKAQSRAHVQWLKQSYAGAGAELFLDSTCTNVRTTSILCTLPGDVRFAAEPGVWRDPLTSGHHLPPRHIKDKADPFSPTTCDSCLSLQRARDKAQYNPVQDDLDGLRLPAVDLYAGGGGLLFGVNQHFDVQHAVEIDAAACATLRQNFPTLKVSHCAVSDFAQKRRLRPGNVALLVAGPPCQGFTLANYARSLDNPSNGEVFMALKEVERLKPDVFILENVPGICTPFKHGGRTLNILAQVVRKLVGDLGYQVRLGKLNSRDYGSPQDRHRIFVLAVRPGLPLPSWPTPTHANPKPKTLSFTAGDETVVLGSTASGPRRAVTARDAIGDMPNVANGIPFDYDYLEALVLPNGGVGVLNGAPYRRPPMTSYQKAARGRQVGVRDHFTQYPPRFVLDLVRHAPRADEPRAGPGAELRCDPHGAVPTIQRNPFPGRKSTLTIHWNSHRVLSVAERRRVQGLPDSYVLRGSIKDKDTMLGNMVDVHVAKALAAHIKREVFAPSWRAWDRPASVDFCECGARPTLFDYTAL
ncbi:hypothetical protein CspHIS471_0508810 [Cutaneotrichosporon sp. HIS471]|nr:hypothetical protein CspHIS471_0508810 [Cutaneotrichosporon sp. HIS471]